MNLYSSARRFGVPAITAMLLAVASDGAAQTPTLQQLPIFGAQATPDPVGSGQGFPSIEVENVEYCTSDCGYLAEDGYSHPDRIANVKPIADVEAASGTLATWSSAFLSGDHPWGTLQLTPGFAPHVPNRSTNSWVNYRPNDVSVLESGSYRSVRYRVRFNVPSFPRDEHGNPIAATMLVKMLVDNWGKVWINGQAVPGVIWGSGSVDGSAQFALTVQEGLNTIELVVGDGGGLAGFTFLIELSMYADAPLGEVTSKDADGDGVDNIADAFPFDASETTDSDGDGVGDNGDLYPNDPGAWANLTISGVTTSVPARNGAQALLSAGEASCSASTRNHGRYVSCVGKVLNALKAQSMISGAEKGYLESVAARSAIGRK